jgi:hypothetical protein
MDLAILITIAVLAFGVGGWFVRLEYRLNKIDRNFIPLIFLHKEELIKHYIDRGILPNPGMTPRKQYLLDRLKDNTISISEYTELSTMLQIEKQEAQRTNNTEALVAILGILALIAILVSLSKKQ